MTPPRSHSETNSIPVTWHELLADTIVTLNHARKFIVSREKMRPDGVKLYDENIEQLRKAMTVPPLPTPPEAT